MRRLFAGSIAPLAWGGATNQLLVQCGSAVGGQLALPPGAHLRIGPGELEVVDDRSHVQGRSPHQDGDPSTGAQACNHLTCQLLEVGHR